MPITPKDIDRYVKAKALADHPDTPPTERNAASMYMLKLEREHPGIGAAAAAFNLPPPPPVGSRPDTTYTGSKPGHVWWQDLGVDDPFGGQQTAPFGGQHTAGAGPDTTTAHRQGPREAKPQPSWSDLWKDIRSVFNDTTVDAGGPGDTLRDACKITIDDPGRSYVVTLKVPRVALDKAWESTGDAQVVVDALTAAFKRAVEEAIIT